VAQSTSQQPDSAERSPKMWERTIKAGEFIIATILLAGTIIGGWMNMKIQAAVDEANIAALTKQQDKMQAKLEDLGKQQNEILVGVGRVEGEVRTLNDQLSHDPAPKK